MKKPLSLIAVALLPTPVFADEVTISACEVDRRDTVRPMIYCDVENKSERAVASLIFRAVVKSPDREVPWAEIGSDWSKGHARVSGGIEPGETVKVMVSPVNLNSRSDGLPLDVTFPEIQFLDLKGDLIFESLGVQEQHPSATLNKALSDALRAD